MTEPAPAGRRLPVAVVVEGEGGNSLYQAERKVYPRSVQGRFASLRKLAVVVLLGMYYGFPWLTWAGRQAVLFDLPARKFYVFGLAFWPQDFVFLALLLIMAGLSLFFFTAVAGRLWCGYACPQTVWTEVFLWIEHWTEGERSRRIKLDAGPWTAEKWRRKGSKHALWLLLALWTGFTFVGFFTPIRDLGARLVPFAWSGWETFWVLFYSLATWGNAGVLREQVCKYMCPYARFQSAMFDRNTLLIAYDAQRGEPRGARKRDVGSVAERGRAPLPLETAHAWLKRAALQPSAADRQVAARRSTGELDGLLADAIALPQKVAPELLGDCVDCTACVQVCPTGIDIRNGLQYECIACGACIDACDEVMDRLDYPRGLVRYTTQNALDGKPSRVLRPRVLVYGALLLLLATGWAIGVTRRAPLLAEVLRDRNALYRVGAEGQIENAYLLKLVNKTDRALGVVVQLAPGSPAALADGALRVQIGAEDVASVPLTLVAPAGAVHGRRELAVLVEGGGEPPLTARVDTTFFAPP